MKFLLDENVEFRLSLYLKSHGHDVTAIARDYPHGLSDLQVLDIAKDEQRILVTNDRDFGELIFKRNKIHSGVIFFRLRLGSSIEEKTVWLERLLSSHREKLHQFVVITERGIRTRRTTPRS